MLILTGRPALKYPRRKFLALVGGGLFSIPAARALAFDRTSLRGSSIGHRGGVPPAGGGEEQGQTWVAASASQANVASAYSSAASGDIVEIPDGSASWSSGISASAKQVRFRAENYSAVADGSSSRNVTITHNSSSPLFAFTTGNTYHCGLAGIRVNEGTGDGNAVLFQGSGSKIPLLADCYFQNKERFGSAEDVALITIVSLGGLVWNTIIDGTGFGSGGDPGPAVASVSVHCKQPNRVWTTASTMGAADTNGTINTYFENCQIINTGGGDLDDHSRVVVRHSAFDGTTWITHGFTSTWGGRHIEMHDCTFVVSGALRNVQRYFWFRAGHGAFVDNVVNNHVAPQNYGPCNMFDIGDNTSPSGGYIMPRQPGCGHSGSAYVSDPIYDWNATGARAYNWGFNDQPGGWQSYVQSGRDVFVNAGAKPGYTKYPYPHQLREQLDFSKY